MGAIKILNRNLFAQKGSGTIFKNHLNENLKLIVECLGIGLYFNILFLLPSDVCESPK